jgi:hypothetical protein
MCDSLTTLTYLGMDMACYRAWATAGRPALDRWALDRRAEPKPPRECLVCDRPTAQVYFGMDCSCDEEWCSAGRPDRDNWAPTRQAWPDGRARLRSKKASVKERTPA